MKVTILGCGTSGGVPRIGGAGRAGHWGAWGAADPTNPLNRRLRCSILVEDAGKTLLVDTSPDCRQQLLAAEVARIDAVLWTHDHADQMHGIDDLRALALRDGPIEAWADERTMAVLRRRFGYCFTTEEAGFYNPIYRGNIVRGPFAAAGLPVVPFEQDHGTMISLGFRFGAIGYANDVVRMGEQGFAALAGVEVLIVDAMRYKPHPTHAHLELTLRWIERIRPKRAVLTNLHVDMDYATLRRELPDGVEPAYDGMAIKVENGHISIG